MIDFPDSPVVGDKVISSDGSTTFEWDGTVWMIVPSASVPPAVLTSITPNTGTTEADTPVTIVGTGFTAAVEIFSALGSFPVTFVSETELTSTFPSTLWAVGVTDIWVTTAGGESNHLLFTVTFTPKTDVFTTSGTWTKPVGAASYEFIIIGGGQGGGGGAGPTLVRDGPSPPPPGGGTGNYGGQGGEGGWITSTRLAAENVPAASYVVTVGVGGAGGTSPASAAAGNPGTAGTASSVDGLLTSNGVPMTSIGGRYLGAGGPYASATDPLYSAGSAAAANKAAGGGAGGTAKSDATTIAGKNGGTGSAGEVGGLGGTGGAPGGPGVDTTVPNGAGSGSGGGGGGSNGGVGGVGGARGAAGGGGANFAAGGRGADGIVVVVST